MTLALLIAAVGGAWAQSANPEVIELKPDETGKKWTLAKMPASNIELQVEYFAESNLFLSKDALADKTNIAVTAGELGVQFDKDGKSANTVTEGTPMTVKFNGTKKLLGMKVEKKAAAAPSVSFTVKRVDHKHADGNYTVAPGTTWQQFIESGDAPACLSIGTSGNYNGKVCHDMDGGLTCCGGTLIANVADKKRVKASDAIIDGATYGCSDYCDYEDHD